MGTEYDWSEGALGPKQSAVSWQEGQLWDAAKWLEALIDFYTISEWYLQCLLQKS